MKKTSILYVEDDPYLGYVTKDNLELRGYEVTFCKDGHQALETFNSSNFDLCILDVMLPKLDGFSVAQEIRKKDEHIPLIFLSAKSMKEDRIKGLTIGGDDYITKPFSIDELVLKIEIFLKRNKVTGNNIAKGEFRIGKLIFHATRQILETETETFNLTSRETELLKFLVQNENIVLKKEEILKEVWGDDSYFNSRSLDVFISKLRKYLKSDPGVTINNIHGIGFILVSG
ncbi:MAG: response regulator transcription factor [Bacteroidales bacterium]|nr:response regulator transcription factor [Bacteroidales bacterium]MCF8405448.1 response regulator transcription factor [Bacteroidales bacterium]